MNLLWGQVQLFGKDRVDPLVNDKEELVGNVVEVVLVLKQILYRLDRNETFVPRSVRALGVQDRWANDSSEIGHVHSRSSLLVLVRKGSNPFEENEEHFHGIAIGPRE